MKTIIVQIGNTDNKLSQQDWAKFCNEIHLGIMSLSGEIHFSAPSVGWADWQNSAWIFSVEDHIVEFIKLSFISIRKKYLQDSLAWMICNEAEFI